MCARACASGGGRRPTTEGLLLLPSLARSLVRSAFPRPSSKPCSVRPLRAHSVSLKGRRGGNAHEDMTFSLHHCPCYVQMFYFPKNLRTEIGADPKKVHWHLVKSAFWPRKIDRLSSNLPRQRKFSVSCLSFPSFWFPLSVFWSVCRQDMRWPIISGLGKRPSRPNPLHPITKGSFCSAPKVDKNVQRAVVELPEKGACLLRRVHGKPFTTPDGVCTNMLTT